jgi:hypothetical protein
MLGTNVIHLYHNTSFSSYCALSPGSSHLLVDVFVYPRVEENLLPPPLPLYFHLHDFCMGYSPQIELVELFAQLK